MFHHKAILRKNSLLYRKISRYLAGYPDKIKMQKKERCDQGKYDHGERVNDPKHGSDEKIQGSYSYDEVPVMPLKLLKVQRVVFGEHG